ncbi:lvivd repeat-containing protein [Catenovulum agarivorans DS-2]|uniref:Lvivd repeat-containing protein n=1 Tax=Catenovulum agarivorans DS-2 TaxID=1328313 RepID=W7QJ10_9ALTE|nr:hypothetical protein [Catenovulum agarivorans]EWH08118.1 lvivd repeat-containing protein [Catenovulum agarivorans DS-2]
MRQLAFDWPALAGPSVINASLPSFLHVIFMCCLTLAVPKQAPAKVWKIPLAWFAISVVLELMQLEFVGISWLAGTFDWFDILAAALAAAVIALHSSLLNNRSISSKPLSLAIKLPLILVGSLSAMGSYWDVSCDYPDKSRASCDVSPLYMRWQDIRTTNEVYFSAENANGETQAAIDQGGLIREYQGIDNPGKIYVFNQYLFVNDQLKGIHIFDNSDQANPKYLAFVRVVGATDLEVLNGVMYVNSFTDVVAVELTAPFNYYRTENVLPYPSVNNWLPARVRFFQDEQRIEIDQNRGMVVGYETEEGKRFFFWDVEL